MSTSTPTPAPFGTGWALTTGLAALAVYLLTLAPDITWANFGVDGGELITAAVTLGVPHPPGYPTYVLLGKLFSYLPLGTVAYRFNLFSAVSIAIAAAFVTLATGRWGSNQRSWPVATAAGLSFAFAPLVWSQALIAEVYGLNLLFLAIFLWTLLQRRPSWLSGLFLGLSVTSHLTSLLMIPLALFYTARRQWGRLAAGFTLGLVPLLAIPWLAQTESPIVWGRPFTLEGWWWLVSGQLYRNNLFAVPAAEVGPRLAQWGTALLNQFTWLGLPLIIWSLAQARKEAARPRERYLLAATAVFYIIYSIGYGTPDAIVFLLPALLLLSILLVSGLQKVGWLALCLPLISLMLNFSEQNLNDEQMIRPLATHFLQTPPPAALLVSPGDHTIFTLWYFHHVEHIRSDIILVDSNLFAFDWYRQRLKQQYPGLRGLEVDDLERFRHLNEKNRPYCLVRLAAPNPQASCSIE